MCTVSKRSSLTDSRISQNLHGTISNLCSTFFTCYKRLKTPMLKVKGQNDLCTIIYNWASEASPTLGCSIEISRDICRYVGLSTKNSSTKNLWAELRGPNTRMLKVSCGQLKLTHDTCSIHFDYTIELL